MLFRQKFTAMPLTALALIGMTGMVASAQRSDNALSPWVIILNEKSNNQKIPLHVDDELVLRLQADPDRGRHWVWLETDPTILKRVDARKGIASDTSDSHKYQEFQVRALRTGRATIQLDYEMPGNWKAQSPKTFQLQVQVIPKKPPVSDNILAPKALRNSNRPFTLFEGENFISLWNAGRFWGNRPPNAEFDGSPTLSSGLVISRF